MPKDRLLRIIINNKRDRKSLLNQREEDKKVFISQQQIAFFNQNKEARRNQKTSL